MTYVIHVFHIYISCTNENRVKQPLNTASIYDRHVSADCRPQCENTDNFLVLICCIKVFDVIYPFAFDDVRLNKFDKNLLDFVAYISVELVVESIGRVCFQTRDSIILAFLQYYSGLLSCPLSCPVLQ